MTKITFRANVTEHCIFPPKENETVLFDISDECVVINMIGYKREVLSQTEIDMESAVELANCILFMAKQKTP